MEKIIQMTEEELDELVDKQRRAFEASAEVMIERTVLRTLTATNSITLYISRAEANRLYGKHTIQRWIDNGDICPCKGGESQTSRVRILREDLMSAAARDSSPMLPSTSGTKRINLKPQAI